MNLIDVGEIDWHGAACSYDRRTTRVMYHPETDRFYWGYESFEEVNDLAFGTLWALTSALALTLSDVALESDLTPEKWEIVSGDVVDVLAAAMKARENRG